MDGTLSHELPTRNAIDSLNIKIQPKVISQEIKCSVSYPDLIQDTVKGPVKSEKRDINDGDVLQLVAKTETALVVTKYKSVC